MLANTERHEPVLSTAVLFFTAKFYCSLLGGFVKKYPNSVRIIAALAVCVRIQIIGCSKSLFIIPQ
jgi:hypothetical protein